MRFKNDGEMERLGEGAIMMERLPHNEKWEELTWQLWTEDCGLLFR